MKRLLSLSCFALLTLAAGCGGFSTEKAARKQGIESSVVLAGDARDEELQSDTSIFDAFSTKDNEQKVQVNRYLWAASLDVLSFLPIESVDPFTGLIVTGFGTPPGGGRSYKATVHIRDPALDARALSVAMQTSGGSPVGVDTTRAVEDAILSRARQLRIADGKL